MKFLILPGVTFLLLSCTKFEVVYLPAPSTQINLDKSISLIRDTTVNGIWDGHGNKLIAITGKIYGKGTLINWDIDASVNQVLFDTSINLKNITTAKTPFSTIWYGTNSSNADNWWNIQKSINVCRDNHLECFTPGKGTYKFSKPLECSVISGNAYEQTSIHFSGDASQWDDGRGTSFQYTGLTEAAFIIQLNKGTELNNFELHGMWKAPQGSDMSFYNLKESQFKDVSGYNLKDDYSGIAVDWHKPLDGQNRSGSTGTYIHSVSLSGFGMGLANSQNAITLNNDNMTVDHLYLMDNIKHGIVNGQAQEKGMHFTNIYSWGSIYNVINIGLHGQHQAGNYSFDGVYIAGRCIEPINISVAHWYSSTFNNVFAERIRDIGTFAGQIPIHISNSTFDLMLIPEIGRQMIVTSDNGYTEFDNCTIRYYDNLNTDLWVFGYMIFKPNCYFGGGNIIWK